MISFTGSTTTGRMILEQSAPTFKRTLMELGGKSATIVLDDCNLSAVLPQAVMTAFMHAGQGCALPTRLLIPESRYEEWSPLLQQC